jgi:hypothetical protein
VGQAIGDRQSGGPRSTRPATVLGCRYVGREMARVPDLGGSSPCSGPPRASVHPREHARMEVLATPPGPQHARELPRWMVVFQQAAAADGRRGSIERAGALEPRSRELPTAFHTTVAGTCLGIAALNTKRPRRYMGMTSPAESSALAAPRNPVGSLRCCERDGRSHSRSSIRTFVRWRRARSA